MAKPISTIALEENQVENAEESLAAYAAEHADSLKQAMVLLQELNDNGVLEILVSLLRAKEKVAKIAIEQIAAPQATNMINNGMAAAGALSRLNPEFTAKLAEGLTNGMAKAEEGMKNGEKAGMLDLLKAMKDPDINRTITFGINLLKGIGEGLK